VELWTRIVSATKWGIPGPASAQLSTIAAAGNGNVFIGGTTDGAISSQAAPRGRLDGWFMKINGPTGVVPRL
jgi:hypothetical protein